MWCLLVCFVVFFFFSGTAPAGIYTLSLHDALPIWRHRPAGRRRQARRRAQRPGRPGGAAVGRAGHGRRRLRRGRRRPDRKSTRLNSSHLGISYAVFCLKKKKKKKRAKDSKITRTQK